MPLPPRMLTYCLQYFAFSGIKTNLGFLDNGITWGYTILICVVAFFSKFIGCAGVAFFCGFSWRESGAIGSLMSCKGLVELIVLNVGLSAGILDTRTFSMFVLHALVLTFMTTPLTLLFYPSKYRTKMFVTPRGGDAVESGSGAAPQEDFKSHFTVLLEKIEQLPAAMSLTQLLQPVPTMQEIPSNTSDKSSTAEDEKNPGSPPGLSYTTRRTPSPVHVDALRIIELTERTSDVLKSQSVEALVRTDSILSIFRTFGYLNRMTVSAALAVVGWDEIPSHVANHVRESGSEMLILPWHALPSQEAASQAQADTPGPSSSVSNPFEGVFGLRSAGAQGSSVQTQFFRRMFAEAKVDTALFVERGVPHVSDGQGTQHIFMPFFGGPDDRLALSFVVQLCLNPATSATVVRFTKVDADELTPVNTIDEVKKQQHDHTHISVCRSSCSIAAEPRADNSPLCRRPSPIPSTHSATRRRALPRTRPTTSCGNAIPRAMCRRSRARSRGSRSPTSGRHAPCAPCWMLQGGCSLNTSRRGPWSSSGGRGGWRRRPTLWSCGSLSPSKARRWTRSR